VRKRTLVVILLVVWVLCGVFNYGGTYAYFQDEFSLIAEDARGKHRAFAFTMGVFGPFATPVVVWGSEVLKHGWRLN